MSKEKYKLDEYNNWVHRFGRIGGFIAIAYMLSIPFIIGIMYDALPTMSDVLKGGIGVLALFIPIGISEVISYTPILGSSSYLTFLTGNILNLKVPCVLNALKLSNTDQNTHEGDAIATVAVASSSILTMLIIMIGVLLIVPLRPVLESPVVSKATAYILPALFGSMLLGFIGKGSGEYIIENKLLAIVLPVIIVSLTTIFGILSPGLEGIAIILMLPITLVGARIMWKKGIIRVKKREEVNKQAQENNNVNKE